MKQTMRTFIEWASRPFFWLYRRWHYRPVKIDAIRLTTDPVSGDLIVIVESKRGNQEVIVEPNPDMKHFYPEQTVYAEAIRGQEVTPGLEDYTAL